MSNYEKQLEERVEHLEKELDEAKAIITIAQEKRYCKIAESIRKRLAELDPEICKWGNSYKKRTGKNPKKEIKKQNGVRALLRKYGDAMLEYTIIDKFLRYMNSHEEEPYDWWVTSDD